MRSYVVTHWGEPLEPLDRPTPEPQGREVLVKVTAAGVCHSDVHIHDGYYDMGGGKKKTADDRGLTLPRAMGHESAGEVVAMGPEATGVEIGQSVAVYPWIGCGRDDCDACALGEDQNCPNPRSLGIYLDGGYATHLLVPDAKYCVDHTGISAEVAALYACSGLTAFNAVRKIRPDVFKREPTLVIGAGGLGMNALAIIRALGGHAPIVADIDESKFEAAIELGAMACVNSAAPDAAEQIRALSPSGRGLRAVIDFTAIPATFNLALDVVVKGCQIVLVGLMGGEVTFPLPMFQFLSVSLQGNYTGTLQDMKDLISLAQQGNLTPPRITTRPLDEVQSALDDLRASKVVGRTVLVP